MHIEEASIPGVFIITPIRHRDDRGFFTELYNKETLLENHIEMDFVQDNYSVSTDKNTVRGLHYQEPPFAQCKLVSVLQGSVLDVAVDIRKSSSTFGQHVAVELSAANGKQLWVPEGFAHGFCTMSDATSVLYKVSAPYSTAHDKGIFWNDPVLEIDWPASAQEGILSEKDKLLPRLEDMSSPFD